MALTDSSRSQASAPGRLWQVTNALKVGKLPVLVWLYLFTIALPIGFNIGSLAMSTMRLLLLLSVVPLMFSLVSGKAGRVIPTDILFILHILWATLAVAVNNPSRVVENMGSTGIEFLGGYLIGRVMIRTPEQFLALCRAMFWLIIILIPFALYENFTGRSVILETIRSIPGFDTFADTKMPKRMGLERAQSIFAHPIHFGVFCSLMFSMCFVAFKGVISSPMRYLISGAIAVGTFLSLSSGALLPVVLESGLIFYAFLLRSNPKRWHILLSIIAFFYVLIDLLSNRTPIEVFMSIATFSSHNAYWRRTIFQYGMLNVWANPIFGLGLRNWFRPVWMVSGSMDNFWLVMAVRYGIPGFLLLALGYADLVRRTIMVKLTGDEGLSRIRLAMVFTYLGITFSLTTVHIWTAAYSYMFFLIGSCVWIIYCGPRQIGVADVTDAEPVRGPIAHSRGRSSPEPTRIHTQVETKPRANLAFSRRVDGVENTTPHDAPYSRSQSPDEERSDRESLRYSRFEEPPDRDNKS